MLVYQLKCKDCDSHVYQHHIKEGGHEIDFDGVKILDRASNDDKLCWKEMLYIRKLKPSLNVQKESQLFTLIIRNTKQEDSITKDFQKYLNNKKSKYSCKK